MSTPEATRQALQTQEKPRSLQAMIESSAKELGRALPEHMRPERLVRIALTCIRTTPDLSKCTPESFLGALFTSAQLGIEPIAGRAYLIPFNNSRKKPDGSWHTVKECQFVMGYKGLVDLFYRHDKAVSLEWGVVREKDEFEFSKGTDSFIRHRIDPRKNNVERGDVFGYWVMARLHNGGCPFHYMAIGECLDHGETHSKTFDKPNSPWKTDRDAMCLKTVLVQLCKILPLSVELQTAIDQDETTRTIRPGVDNVLDIPSETDWDSVEKEAEKKIDEIVSDGKQVEKTGQK